MALPLVMIGIAAPRTLSLLRILPKSKEGTTNILRQDLWQVDRVNTTTI